VLRRDEGISGEDFEAGVVVREPERVFESLVRNC
jgi:hypothetical protein